MVFNPNKEQFFFFVKWSEIRARPLAEYRNRFDFRQNEAIKIYLKRTAAAKANAADLSRICGWKFIFGRSSRFLLTFCSPNERIKQIKAIVCPLIFEQNANKWPVSPVWAIKTTVIYDVAFGEHKF